jgi:predicted nuclease of predicted toxin-antitoxin system
MRFIVDECTGPKAARWLAEQGYEVFSIYDQARGISDDEIILKASAENWILITNAKDFGEKIHRGQQPHNSVVLLRLEDERSKVKIEVLKQLLENYSDRVENQFVVVSEKSVRVARS